jgi:hypothetical protein
MSEIRGRLKMKKPCKHGNYGECIRCKLDQQLANDIERDMLKMMDDEIDKDLGLDVSEEVKQ